MPEVMITPLMPASPSIFAIASASGLLSSSFSTFIERPGMSSVSVTMPSLSFSKLTLMSAPHTRSMMVAIPMPAPTQSEARPVCLS